MFEGAWHTIQKNPEGSSIYSFWFFFICCAEFKCSTDWNKKNVHWNQWHRMLSVGGKTHIHTARVPGHAVQTPARGRFSYSLKIGPDMWSMYILMYSPKQIALICSILSGSHQLEDVSRPGEICNFACLCKLHERMWGFIQYKLVIQINWHSDRHVHIKTRMWKKFFVCCSQLNILKQSFWSIPCHFALLISPSRLCFPLILFAFHVTEIIFRHHKSK